MKTALVTGGAGFIGSQLVRRLVECNIYVRVLDNLSSGNPDHLAGLRTKIEFIEGDVRNALACSNACRNMEAVFHLAALISPSQSAQDPVRFDAVNIGGTLNLLLAARDRQVRRFVFSSSAAVYGDTSVIPTHETVLPTPMSPYGIQKLTGEHYTRNFHQLYGLETVCLRYFNVYGPGQNPFSEYAAVVPRFITRILEGQPPTIYGDGEQTRDFCAVGDVVNANLLAAETTNSEAFGSVFNIAGGERISLNALIASLGSVLEVDLTPSYEAGRIADIRHSGADITRARTVLGYSPQISLEAGLKQTIAFYRSRSVNLAGSVGDRIG